MNEQEWLDPTTDLLAKFLWLRFNGQLCDLVYSTIGLPMAFADKELIQQRLDQVEPQKVHDRLCCVAGNPFRAVSLIPDWLAWNDATVVKIANAIYIEQQFGTMPILADALQDSGCDDVDILTHSREKTHFQDCWVLRLLQERRQHLLPSKAVILAVFPEVLKHLINWMRTPLEHYGFTILTTRDVQEAIQLYERGGVDVVLINYTQYNGDRPNSEWVEYAFDSLQRLDPKVRCIVTSFYNLEDLAGMQEMMGRGLMFLPKRLWNEELLRFMYSVVGQG